MHIIMDNRIKELINKGFEALDDGERSYSPKDVDAAIKAFQKIRTLDPCNEVAWYQLYSIYLSEKKDMQTARHVLENVYALNPKDFKVLSILGGHFQSEKVDLEKSDYYFDLLLLYYPDKPETYSTVGYYLLTRDHERAIKMLYHAIELDKTFINPYITLVSEYKQSHDYKTAYAIAMQGLEKGVEVAGRANKSSLRYHLNEIEKKLKHLISAGESLA
jgi:tetratricopeptide (TPR) repeat protein